MEAHIRRAVTDGVFRVAKLSRAIRGSNPDHPYLQGLHTPMTAELTIENLAVTGDIPPALNGLYARNGPNPFEPKQTATHHWFVGDAMVHGIRLRDGKALWYRNRWLRSTRLSNALGEPPVPGPRSPIGAEVANTNVIRHANKLWAIVEAGAYPIEVSAGLDTLRMSDFSGTLGPGFSAHPHLDPDTNELHAVCYYGANQGRIWHVVVDEHGRVRRREPIPVNHGPMIHDCMITESYVLVFDLPVTFSMQAMVRGARLPYEWNPKHNARIGLLPREGQAEDIVWCPIDPCFFFHAANAYENDNGEVVLDACVHATMFQPGATGPDSRATPFERFVLDPRTAHASRTIIDATSQEFPRPDERRIGKPYRYAYTAGLADQSQPGFNADSRLYKHDLINRTRETRDFGEHRVLGEFVFVPSREDSDEDEGWLLGLVIDAHADTTDLVILNAQDVTGAMVATITVPHRIPPGFHGNFLPLPD
ncbi:MAG: carotenoid oxygenase family protein [Pseudomonadota bacterium]